MTDDDAEMDTMIAAMLQAVANTICEELPDAGFVLILGRSATEDENGSLLSLSNLDDENVVNVLETVLARRRMMRSTPPSEPTLQ
jgi:hypothetical protein